MRPSALTRMAVNRPNGYYRILLFSFFYHDYGFKLSFNELTDRNKLQLLLATISAISNPSHIFNLYVLTVVGNHDNRFSRQRANVGFASSLSQHVICGPASERWTTIDNIYHEAAFQAFDLLSSQSHHGRSAVCNQ